MKTAQKEWAGAISESAFQAQVIQLARMCGWMVAHFRPAMTRRGRWVTPVQADGAGFPDLVMVRPPRLIFAELKSRRGRVSIKQQIWIDVLWHCPQVEAHHWRPADWDEIERILKR